MHKVLVLWAVPRSTSTAFEWMMRMRGDMTCFHEPFGEAWYRGEDARWPRRDPGGTPVAGLSFASVRQELMSAAAGGPVFCKDFAHYVSHLRDDGFLDQCCHSFLIRDPAKVVTSMYRHWPEFLLEETGFCEQRELFDRLCDRDGIPPVVIDSDDLLENPRGMVEAYCGAVGIPFIEAALTWEPGDRAEVSWYDGGSWHGNLRESDGLKPQPRRAVDIDDVPERIREIHDAVLPHFSHLHSFRLSPG